jgi:hypothetical protein
MAVMPTRREFSSGLGALALLGGSGAARAQDQAAMARATAKDAYIYGYPLVDGYRIIHAYFVNKAHPEYKGAWNVVHSIARVFTPEDKAVQTPNSDTPYSMLGMDLRAEPIVLTVPPIEKERYFSIQLVDAYTFNFDYIGSRVTGNNGGHFMIVGPNWRGATPQGITKVIRSETEIAIGIYRTQLFNPGDLENVKKIQAGYLARPLSAFLGQAAPPPAPPIAFVPPLTPATQRNSLEFYRVLNFVLTLCPTAPSEVELMKRFAGIGVGAGLAFDPASLPPPTRAAMQEGMADALAEFARFKQTEVDTGKVHSGDMFGTRDFLKNNYLYRMAAAILGIYGNSKQEAMYPFYSADANGQPLTGARKYTLRFAPGQLPPVNAFWSLTMYQMPESLLVANPIKRYLLNSPMIPQFRKDPDGGYTFYIQNESPGADKEANWLPAPKGPFMAVMRLYWPKEEALTGRWKPPTMAAVG